jgi:hypothetical protein
MRPRSDMREASARRLRDWVAGGRSFALAWGFPGLALAGSLFVEPPWRAWIWVPSLLWMGAACTANARRCGRTHCYFTAPFFLLLACVTLLDSLGLLALGAGAWTWLGLGLVIGTAGLWWGTERLWGRFLRFDLHGQASIGSAARHCTTLRNGCRGIAHEVPRRGPQKPRPNPYGETMSTYTLHITGMTCDGRRRLERLAGCVGRGLVRRGDCPGEGVFGCGSRAPLRAHRVERLQGGA